jgi:hypothetical protein
LAAGAAGVLAVVMQLLQHDQVALAEAVEQF